MAKDKPTEDITELAEQAKIVADATGRDEADVLADLLDDGIVNLSNEKKDNKDLVTQLKEAAELINTVQSINQEVSENTVLNGGDNSTEIKVETTLEGDIVDRAIASVERKAEKIRKIAIIIAPILLLLTGGVGLDFFLDGGGESDSDYYYDEIWGCTAPDADNYMPEATNDDGSCKWSGNNGGGGGGPPCNPMWRFDDNSYMVDSNIVVEIDFYDDEYCGIQLNGHFVVFLYQNGESYDDAFINVGEFKDFVSGGTSFDDLPEGNYHFTVEFHDIECEDGSCEHGDEWTSPHQPSFYIEEEEPLVCDAYLQNEQAYLESGDAEQDAVRVSADVVVLVESEDACDSEQFELTWRLEQSGSIKYEHKAWEAGSISDSDGADYITHLWDSVDAGTYQPKVVLKLNGDILDEKFMNSITVEEPQPEEPCDVEIINHYRGHVADDAEQDAILVAFRVAPTNCEGDYIEIDIELYQNGYDANYTHNQIVSGDNITDISHIFDGVEIGNGWIPRITASLNDEQLEQVWFWAIDVEKQVCEINLFWIDIGSNSTHASVGYDLDCGYSDNNLEGYNVSVQFLVYEVNGSNSGPNATGPIKYITDVHYIQGWVEDNNFLTLTNFTDSNATHYDFYWYAIWTDGNGEQQMIERTWLNREISA